LSYWTKLETFCFAAENIKKWIQNRAIQKI